MLYDLTTEDDVQPSDDQLAKFISELRRILFDEYPHIEKQRKGTAPVRQYRSLEELRDEARKVFEMIKEIPSMPEKEGEVYHVVSIEWFNQWKSYTDYNSIVRS